MKKEKTKKRKIVTKVVWLLVLVAVLVVAHPVYVKKGSDTATVLAENFMEKHMYSLKDYEIIDAELNDEYLGMSYSVQPKPGRHYFNWNAGNGHTGEDGWLVDKYACVWYFNIGNLYFTGIQANTGW